MKTVDSDTRFGPVARQVVSEVQRNLTSRHGGIGVVLAVALVIRVAIVLVTNGLPAQIEDERHYLTLAGNLREGLGFGWGENTLTSIRPPLFPAFITLIWALVGTQSLEAVRWAHIPVSLLGVILVYEIGRRWFDERSAIVAAAGLALYPSLLFSGVLLLTETLFTTLLLVFVLCMTHVQRGSWRAAAGAGIFLGLAALTRSVVWPFIGVAAPLAWFIAPPGRRHRAIVAISMLVGYVAVIAPWAVRNTALNGTPVVVDTIGGLNLMMGNYAHTPEDRMWDAISLPGDRAWHSTLPATAPDGSAWTEGKKERWARGEAIEYMFANPLTTIRRSSLKFADFWGLERDFIAGVQRGYYNPPLWMMASAAVATTLVYVATAMLAVVGLCLAPPNLRAHLLLAALGLFFAAVHSIVFGHSRYHLPLVPILLLYAASAATSGRWRAIFSRAPASLAAVAMVIGLLTIWSREVLIRDWDRIVGLVVPS